MRTLGRRATLLLVGLVGLAQGATLTAATLRDSAQRRGTFIGVSIDLPDYRNEPPYGQIVRGEFNMLVAGNAFKWDALRPSQTTFNFADTDFLLNEAEANGMTFRGHTLVWHNQLPGWLVNGNFTRDQTIALLREHILTVVGRYRGRIHAWDVVNEAMADGTGQLRTNSFWFTHIGADYIPMAFQFAHEADPNAILYYNDYEAEGLGQKSDAVFNLVQGLVNSGIPIGGVGWQMHKVNPFRMDASFTTNAQRIAGLGLEVSITEMDVRIQLPSSPTTFQQQALAYRDAQTFCLATPNCKALVIWGVTDKHSWIPGVFPGFGDALIYDLNYAQKPAYLAIQSVLDGVLTPPAPTGLTATAGNAQVQLSWSAASGATSYNVKRATTNGGPYTNVGTTTSTTFTNTGLTNGTQYFFVVSGVNASGEGPNSSQVSATPQAANVTLSASPSSLTVARGTSGTSTVTLTRTGGFASSVALSASGLPSGVTAAFNPASTTGTTSTLTLTASSTATLGTAAVTVTGTGGGLTRTTTINLTVAATPTFTLSANPSSVTANRGSTGTSTVTLARTSFTSSVALSATGLPSGVTAAFNPTSTTGTSSTVTFTASATATLGTATVTITGTGGGLTRTTTVNLTVGAGSSGGNGGVTATPVINANGPWFNDEAVRIANTAPLTSLSLTIVVQRTTGVSFSGLYNTVGGQITQANSSTATAVTYTFALAAGQTLGIGTNWTFAAQTSGNGTAHPTAGDTYTLTYTTGGTSFTQSGHF